MFVIWFDANKKRRPTIFHADENTHALTTKSRYILKPTNYQQLLRAIDGQAYIFVSRQTKLSLEVLR